MGIQERDIDHLRETVGVELNLVVTPRQEMARFAFTAKPTRVTFIPERLENAGGGGLDVMLNSAQLNERVRDLRESSIFPSIYLDPSIDQVKAAHSVGALGVEISTVAYVAASEGIGMASDNEAIRRELQRVGDCAKLGLHVGVSHRLTLRNTPKLIELGSIHRVNVGHDLVARAMMVGLDAAVREWMTLLAGAAL